MKAKSTKINPVFTLNNLIPEYVCPVCGKHFIMPAGTDLKRYCYKKPINGRPQSLCSYHCFRAIEKQVEDAKALKKAEGKLRQAENMRKNVKNYWDRKRAAI